MYLKRKKMVAVLLVVLISLAVYLNATYKKGQGNYDLTEDVMTEETSKNPGEAKFVDNLETEGEGSEGAAAVSKISDYFSQARLLRTSAKDEALSILKKVTEDGTASEETKQKALLDMTTIAKTKEQEGNAEGLIKAKGFVEAMVYISESNVNVAVQSTGLSKEQIAQIKDIVIDQTGFKAEKIKITEVK